MQHACMAEASAFSTNIWALQPPWVGEYVLRFEVPVQWTCVWIQ